VAFPLDIRTELLLNGAWSDISSDVYVRDAMQLSRGRRDQGQATDPSSLSLTINNKSGKYSPRNAMSPLYGQIGRNTQLRVSVPATDKYLSLDGDPANYVSTPDTAALDITGDIDIRAEISPNWYGPDSQVLIGKWDAASNQRSWLLRLTQGQLIFNFTTTGISSTGTGFFFSRSLQEIPARGAVRVTLDADNGAGGRTVQFYTSTSITGTWVPLGGPIVLSGYGTTPMFSGTAPLVIGGTDLTTNPKRFPMIGRGYKYEVRNGIGGTVVASPDFTAQAAGATSFTDGAGLLWTLNGGAEVRDREDRFLGEVSTWPSKWTPDESDIYVPIQANGILRRLGQGLKALDSTLRRRIPSGNPVAYWPMEDGEFATRAWSPIPGVDSAALAGVDWASASDLPSSNPLPKIQQSGTLSAPIPASMPSGEWQVEMVYNADDKIPAVVTPGPEFISFSSPNGTVKRWAIIMMKNLAIVRGYDSSTNMVVDKGIGLGDDAYHGWQRLRFWVREDSGTVTWQIGWQDIGGSRGIITETYAGTAGRLSAITANWGAAHEGWAIGHLSVLPTSASGLYDGSDNAYLGETAWNRIMRLGTEESVPVERIHGLLTSEAVGPQRPKTLVDLFEEAASADNGFLLESLNRVGLVFRDRSSMYTQDPALTLSYNKAGLAPDLEPVDDDSSVRNDVEVTRDGGSSARAFLSDGPLSVQAPPLGIGLYDEGLTLSLANDTQPEPMANWLLHLGTFDGARYPSITVMLHKPGAEVLIPQILSLREGDKIRLTDLPGFISHEDVDLIVNGYSEVIEPYRWEITFNCSPGGPWNTAQVENTSYYAKADTDGTVLALPVGTTDTTLMTTVTAGPQWVESAQEFPFDIHVSGERMRVESVGQLFNTNPDFRNGLTGWVGQSTGSVALSTDYVHPRGLVSAKVTPNGVSTSNSLSMSTHVPAVAGQSYTGGYWVYSPAGYADFRVSFDWYNASNVSISTTSQSAQVIPAGQWTYLTFTATAPALTGFMAVRVRQGVTPPAGAIYYVWGIRLTSPIGGESVADTFGRTSASGWGNAESGQAWTTVAAGGVATDFAVSGGLGQHVHSTKNILRHTLVPAPSADVDLITDWAMDKTALTDSNYMFLFGRYTDTTHMYFARVQVVGGTQAMNLTIRKRNGAETQVGGSVALGTFAVNTFYTTRFQISGSTLRAKSWLRSAAEPAAWQLEVTDTDLTAAGSIGFRSLIGNTSTQTLPVTISADNFKELGTQQFTVTRSVNGVVKPQVAGTAIALADPAIASL
jgi:hypothetical protein